MAWKPEKILSGFQDYPFLHQHLCSFGIPPLRRPVWEDAKTCGFLCYYFTQDSWDNTKGRDSIEYLARPIQCTRIYGKGGWIGFEGRDTNRSISGVKSNSFSASCRENVVDIHCFLLVAARFKVGNKIFVYRVYELHLSRCFFQGTIPKFPLP